MADITQRYERGIGEGKGNVNYIGKGILLLTTITILVLSLRPYKFCCSDEKKGKKDKNDENSNFSDDNKDDKKLDLFLCNCVWTNPYGLIVMIIILFFLLGTTLYIPENPSLPRNLPFVDKMKLKIIGFFAAFKNGFMGFLNAVKTNIPAALKGKGGKILFGILALAAFIYTIYVISYTIKTVALLFVVFGALALIYKYVKNSSTSKVLSLLISVVFYIPCLLRDLFTYLHKELRLSTPIEWSILFVEIVVIMLFFIIPKIYNSILNSRSTVLVSDSVYTNVETEIENRDRMYKKINNGDKNPDIKYANPKATSLIKKHDYNYGISLWLYIDSQPPNTSYAYEKFTRVFSYQRMPEILYKGTTNELKIIMQKDVLNRKKEKQTSTVYKTKDLPLQKWNHFIINYDSGTLDVFINNKLVISNKNISPNIDYETIHIGSDNGVHGGIRNVRYFNEPLTKREIDFLYKSGKN